MPHPLIRQYLKILFKESEMLNRTRFSLLSLLLLSFLLQRLCLLVMQISYLPEMYIWRTVILALLFLAGLGLLLLKGLRTLVSNLFIAGMMILLWSTVLIFAHGINVVVIQYILIIISGGYYLLGSGWGLFYSLLNLIPVTLLILFSRYTGIRVTYSDADLNINFFNFVLISNFMILLMIHFYFFNAFKKMNKREQRLKGNLQRSLKLAQDIASAKSNFLSNMSHELRTPLNAVITMANVLYTANKQADKEEDLQLLLFSANSLMFIINDILDFDHIDSSRLILQHEPFRLDQLLKNVELAFKPKAIEKNISFEMTVDQDLRGLEIKGDQHRKLQIFSILVDNAIKFTHDGFVSVKAQLKVKNTTDIVVQYSIRDTGIGVNDEQHKEIFDPYIRQAARSDRQRYGTGLGISIANKLLQLQGSKLNLKSIEGTGTTIIFDMRHELVEKRSVSISDQQSQRANKEQNFRVLMAEDNPINVLVLKKMLNQWNIAPHVAVNGHLAVEALKETDFDLILMDINMPVMDGFEATKAIREFADKNKAGVPIIAVTASAEMDISNHPDRQYFDDCVFKPFPPELLKEKIDRLRALKESSYP